MRCLLIRRSTLPEALKRTVEAASEALVDVILVGGSLTSLPIDETLLVIKSITKIPVVLFPGNLLQLSTKADGILTAVLIIRTKS